MRQLCALHKELSYYSNLALVLTSVKMTAFTERSTQMESQDDWWPTPESSFAYDSIRQETSEAYERFLAWREENPEAIEIHTERYLKHFSSIARSQRLSTRIGTRIASRNAKLDVPHLHDELDYFGIINLGEVLTEAAPNDVARAIEIADTIRSTRRPDNYTPKTLQEYLELILPDIRDTEELHWLIDRFQHLETILPEFAIRQGGIGKAARTIMGVMAVATVTHKDLPPEDRQTRLAATLRPAYSFGITYPIIDDILQDSGYIADPSDRHAYHHAIVQGLGTGAQIELSTLPDHPLSEEMLAAYEWLLEAFPFTTHPDLYASLASMYRAQHEDATINPDTIANPQDFFSLIGAKASLSRIVANHLAGRRLTHEQRLRFTGSLLRNQLLDDTRDYRSDLDAGRITPYTLAALRPDLSTGNPLAHTMAYEAFVAHTFYENSAHVGYILAKFGSLEIARQLAGDRSILAEMENLFGDTESLRQLLGAVAGLPKGVRNSPAMLRNDRTLEKLIGANSHNRDPQIVDPRTYISDTMDRVNTLLKDEFAKDNPVHKVIRYTLEAGGKRVRPSLTLMLANSLGIDSRRLDPLLISVELAHTATLLFDDLPAQDDAKLRRGQPTAHVQFAEYEAQLAGISMIAHALGVLSQLKEHFPSDRVTEVVEYVGTSLGAERLSLGQHMDLSLTEQAAVPEILEMYRLKTSSMLEAPLVSLMILADRPSHERILIQQYADNAGIVFQLRDDILDATASTQITGKDSNMDAGKQNIVRTLGVEEAQSLLETHLAQALEACEQLPFPTTLLQNLVKYFATRKK